MAQADQEYVSRAQQRLAADGFHVALNASLAPDLTVALHGWRATFAWQALSVMSQHVFVHRASESSPQILQTMFEEGFKRARAVNRIPLIRGMQFGYYIVLCLVVPTASQELIRFATDRPRKHWALFEFPVVHDLATRQTHYFKGTPLWGAFMFNSLRALADRYLNPTAGTV